MAEIGSTIFLAPEDAVRAFRAKDRLQPTVNWREMMHEQHAVAFTVAKIAKLDLLNAIRQSLDTVIADGGTFEGWKKEMLPRLEKAGWWGAVRNRELTGTDQAVVVNERRLRTIFDTNVRMAQASGHWARIQRQKRELPYLRYLASTSEHKRPLHRLWYGVILPADHPWWKEHFPPNGWGCKCHFEQVSEARMARKGWKVTPVDQIAGADAPPRKFGLPGGQSIDVPAGIDPGFGYNPGTATLRAVADKASRSLDQAVYPGDARSILSDIVRDVAFDQFLAAPEAGFPVMVLDDATRDMIGASARVVRLSADTMNKQAGKRPDLPIDVYRELPDVGASPDVIARDGDNVLILVRKSDGTWTVAVVKRTASGQGLFLLSVRQQNTANIARLLKGKELLLDRR